MSRRIRGRRGLIGVLLLTLAGCGGPSPRERDNRKAFELLLTAITLRSAGELEKDASLIERRHADGTLSDAGHRELMEIVAKARAGDWGGAEDRAYKFRESSPFFR